MININEKKANKTPPLSYNISKQFQEDFISLYNMYKDKIYNYIFSITKSKTESEDILQDIFIKIWQNKDNLNGIENMSAYLFRVTQNQTIDALRKISREILFLSEETKKENYNQNTPMDELLSKEFRIKLNEAISNLSPKVRQVFIMHKGHGVSLNDIANQLNISIFTVQNHMKKALQTIRVFLDKSYPDLFILIIVFLLYRP